MHKIITHISVHQMFWIQVVQHLHQWHLPVLPKVVEINPVARTSLTQSYSTSEASPSSTYLALAWEHKEGPEAY